MPNVSTELLYEVLKSIQADISFMKDAGREVKTELNSIRGTLISIQQDTKNIYSILGRHDDRLDHIEHRLELKEFAEPQRPINP